MKKYLSLLLLPLTLLWSNILMAAAPNAGQIVHGSVTMSQSSSSDWTFVSFGKTLNSNPIVLMSPVSYNGSDPSTIRIKDISQTGFYVQIDEWNYLDGSHTTETMQWVAVVPGVYDTNTGQMRAARISGVDDNWQTRNLAFPFPNGTTPIILANQNSNNGSDATVVRLRNIDHNSFELKVQEEEAGGTHGAAETVGYIAITGYIHYPGQEGCGIACALDDGYIEAEVSSIDENWEDIGMVPSAAQIQTYNGGDTAGLRFREREVYPAGGDIPSIFFELKVEEEQSSDSETGHTNETVGYLRVGGAAIP